MVVISCNPVSIRYRLDFRQNRLDDVNTLVVEMELAHFVVELGAGF